MTTSPNEDEVLDDAGACAFFNGISQRTLRRMLLDGLPHSYIRPNIRRFVKSELIEWTRQRRVSTAEAKARAQQRSEDVRRASAGLRVVQP